MRATGTPAGPSESAAAALAAADIGGCLLLPLHTVPPGRGARVQPVHGGARKDAYMEPKTIRANLPACLERIVVVVPLQGWDARVPCNASSPSCSTAIDGTLSRCSGRNGFPAESGRFGTPLPLAV